LPTYICAKPHRLTVQKQRDLPEFVMQRFAAFEVQRKTLPPSGSVP